MAEGGLLFIRRKKARGNHVPESERSPARADFPFTSLPIALAANSGRED